MSRPVIPVAHPMTPCDDVAPHASLALEHTVLVRRLAVLQKRLGAQWHAHQTQLEQLQTEVIRLRARLLKERTALYWGLKPQAVTDPPCPTASGGPAVAALHGPLAGPTPATRELSEAEAVICKTGCAGHAHPWRSPEGLCLRRGEPCQGGDGLPQEDA